jgi:hypothetical protein
MKLTICRKSLLTYEGTYMDKKGYINFFIHRSKTITFIDFSSSLGLIHRIHCPYYYYY